MLEQAKTLHPNKAKAVRNFAIHIAELLRDTKSEDEDVAVTLKNQRCRILKRDHKNCHIRYVHRRNDNKLIGMLAWHGLELHVMYNSQMNIWELRNEDV